MAGRRRGGDGGRSATVGGAVAGGGTRSHLRRGWSGSRCRLRRSGRSGRGPQGGWRLPGAPPADARGVQGQGRGGRAPRQAAGGRAPRGRGPPGSTAKGERGMRGSVAAEEIGDQTVANRRGVSEGAMIG